MNAYQMWVAFYTIVRKDVIRIFRVWVQTLLPSAITAARGPFGSRRAGNRSHFPILPQPLGNIFKRRGVAWRFHNLFKKSACIFAAAIARLQIIYQTSSLIFAQFRFLRQNSQD